jgi:hypothetical protein
MSLSKDEIKLLVVAETLTPELSSVRVWSV